MRDLRGLGVSEGVTLLVHSSLRSLGWVSGGATNVVHALLDVLGPAGTLVVPTHTANNRDPSRWTDPAIPEAWWPVVRENMPGFDPFRTPSFGVGIIPERVRTWPGAARSGHPQTSFAALGSRAEWIVERHDLESQLGERSPLGRLEQAGAWILLLGVGFDRCTAFHLAEYRMPEPATRENACVVVTPAGRRWVTYTGIILGDGDFIDLGDDFEALTGLVRGGRVGQAKCRVLPLREAVAFAERWFQSHRTSKLTKASLACAPGIEV
ncbi:MAG TPA: AAC(3) family N-acetyltransferase [Micromonosporaceae bacterium]|nr:AAC(3) family N-acetyltransferase [Micromonosporaceae bacterium]